MPRNNPPIQVKPGWTITEVYTRGMKLRFVATRTTQDNDAGRLMPWRKSYNSAAADTHR